MDSFIGVEDLSGYDREYVVRVRFDGEAVGLFFVDVEDTAGGGSLVYLSSGLRNREGKTRGTLYAHRDAKKLDISVLSVENGVRNWAPLYSVENCAYDSYDASYACSEENGDLSETLVLRGSLSLSCSG